SGGPGPPAGRPSAGACDTRPAEPFPGGDAGDDVGVPGGPHPRAARGRRRTGRLGPAWRGGNRTVSTAPDTGLGWLLDDLIARVPSATHAGVLSVDGPLMAASKGLSQGDAEHITAIAAGHPRLRPGA